MLIYHGTTKDYADAACIDGVKPRGKGDGNWPDRRSRPDCVYLTAAFGATYAVSTSVKAGEPESAEVAIIEIDVADDGKLLPDEDFLTECILMAYREDEFEDPDHHRKRALSLSLRDALEEYAGTDWVDLLESRHKDMHKPIDEWIRQYCALDERGEKVKGWEASVFGLGSCAYRGIIPTSSIRRVALVKRSHPILHLLRAENIEPSICDYRANMNRLLTYNAFIFGDGPSRWQQERLREGIRIVRMASS